MNIAYVTILCFENWMNSNIQLRGLKQERL